jgi:transcriptional regulator with XRE-family HTH domain
MPNRPNQIEYFRKRKGLTMAALAKLVGGRTNASVINRLEKGQTKLTADRMELLAAALDCQPADLMGSLVITEILAPTEFSGSQPAAAQRSDIELSAIRTILSAFDALPKGDHRRVLDYVRSRLGL